MVLPQKKVKKSSLKIKTGFLPQQKVKKSSLKQQKINKKVVFEAQHKQGFRRIKN